MDPRHKIEMSKIEKCQKGNIQLVSESTDELRPNSNKLQVWIGNSMQPATSKLTTIQGIQMGMITDRNIKQIKEQVIS